VPVDLSIRTICERVCCYHAPRVKHQVEHDERKGLTEFLKGLGQSYLDDPSAAPLPKDGCSEHLDLRVYEGYACRKCPLRTTNFSSLTRHISTQYFQGEPLGKRELSTSQV
jgi:hypothetical protein